MADNRFTEYRVVHLAEGGCGTMLLGSSGLPMKKIEAELNALAAEGWQVVFQVLEQKRFWLGPANTACDRPEGLRPGMRTAMRCSSVV